MAGRKSTRSSKTDHVLSLLSHSSSPETAPADTPTPAQPAETPSVSAAAVPAETPAADTPAADVPSAPAASTAQRLSPPILEVARTNNEALEETIHQALEAALEEAITTAAPPVPELQQPVAPPQQEPVAADPGPAPEAQPEPPAPEPEPEPEVVEATEPAPEVPETPEPAPEAVETPRPAPAPQSAAPEEHSVLTVLPDGSRLVNVMERLVTEKVEHYAKMFHLCCCPRCLADSTALALSRLPAKYVVLSDSAYRPMMSFLEAKFDSMVTAQIIYACKQVLESPRHDL